MWDELEYTRVAVAGGVVDPGHRVALRVPGHGLTLHRQYHVLKIFNILSLDDRWYHKTDLVKFVMCTLVSRDYVPFCKYIKRHLYPGKQGTHDKLNQIRLFVQGLS